MSRHKQDPGENSYQTQNTSLERDENPQRWNYKVPQLQKL